MTIEHDNLKIFGHVDADGRAYVRIHSFADDQDEDWATAFDVPLRALSELVSGLRREYITGSVQRNRAAAEVLP